MDKGCNEKVTFSSSCFLTNPYLDALKNIYGNKVTKERILVVNPFIKDVECGCQFGNLFIEEAMKTKVVNLNKFIIDKDGFPFTVICGQCPKCNTIYIQL